VTLPLPRALLFDWDNTLVDTWTVIHHALNRTFAEMGHRPWTLDETRRRVRASARDSFPLIFGERAEEAAELFYRIFEADHLAKLRARAGAADLLAGLAARGDLYLAVVSNKRGHILRREAAHLGWDRFFSRLVGANDAAHDKPASEAVEMALAESGIAAGPEVWFVGDTDIDMACAVNTGCLPVLLRDAPPEADEFGPDVPRIHVSDCEALLDLVRRM